MEDYRIIWRFLSRAYPDDHQAIYLYCCGSIRSSQTALDKIMPITLKIFSPPLSENFIKMVVKGFLDNKKKQFFKGEIKVKPIYGFEMIKHQ